ncbi:MAG: phenylalanine--tRNA ligase subunit alpha, partial [Thermoplasmata archaeon]|nr:phenylalanine--tRNA ligase subunit alpha [Thermoplasmata archaeon]
MSEKDVIEQLNFFEKKVLNALHELKRASPEEVRKMSGLGQLVEVMNASSWLQAKGLVKIDEVIKRSYSLKNPQVASRPLPERIAIEVLSKDHKGKGSMADLKKSGKLKNEEISIALGWIRKKGWGEVTKHGTETIITLTETGTTALHTKGEDELLIEKLAKTAISETDAKKEIIEMLK